MTNSRGPCPQKETDDGEERGQKTLLVKPRLDTRDGDHMVSSRIGLTHPCIYFDEMRAMADQELQKYACIIIDEAQFLTKDEVFYLVHLVDDCGIPVLCYAMKESQAVFLNIWIYP